MEILKDFVLESKVDSNVIEKYRSELPSELIEVWEEYGLGSFMNGYLRTINPDEYTDIVKEGYFRADVKSAIPIFTTGFGDVIVWQDEKYLNVLSFKSDRATIIASGFQFFFGLLTNGSFVSRNLEYSEYIKATEKHGIPKYDECFGYVPLLASGGAKKVENLDIVKIKEHILLIVALAGPIVIE